MVVAVTACGNNSSCITCGCIHTVSLRPIAKKVSVDEVSLGPQLMRQLRPNDGLFEIHQGQNIVLVKRCGSVAQGGERQKEYSEVTRHYTNKTMKLGPIRPAAWLKLSAWRLNGLSPPACLLNLLLVVLAADAHGGPETSASWPSPYRPYTYIHVSAGFH